MTTYTDSLLNFNRRDRRRIESIFKRRETSRHDRATLVRLGIPDLFKRAGVFSFAQTRADCFDVWRARAQTAAVIFTRDAKLKPVARNQYYRTVCLVPGERRGSVRVSDRRARNAAKRVRKVRRATA